MLYGSGYSDQQPVNPQGITWLEYIISSNPQGVMKVLASYGYTGYLAPQDEYEMEEVCLDLMDKNGDGAVIDLLKSHPFYEIIKDISLEQTALKSPFKNADGSTSIIGTIKLVNWKEFFRNALIIIGAFYVAGSLLGYLKKSDA